jgi:hypothetical protein
MFIYFNQFKEFDGFSHSSSSVFDAKDKNVIQRQQTAICCSNKLPDIYQ